MQVKLLKNTLDGINFLETKSTTFKEWVANHILEYLQLEIGLRNQKLLWEANKIGAAFSTLRNLLLKASLFYETDGLTLRKK